jgi:hypothetical protein
VGKADSAGAAGTRVEPPLSITLPIYATRTPAPLQRIDTGVSRSARANLAIAVWIAPGLVDTLGVSLNCPWPGRQTPPIL